MAIKEGNALKFHHSLQSYKIPFNEFNYYEVNPDFNLLIEKPKKIRTAFNAVLFHYYDNIL